MEVISAAPDDDLHRSAYINIHAFQALNAMSYQIALGNPLILFAREMGASAFVIGLISAFTPLLSILQLPMASYAQRVGYRPLIVRGWGGRVATLIFLCALPLVSSYLSRDTIVYAIVVNMFFFNLIRGFASGGWLPWITAIVPKSSRSMFLSRDRTFVAFATVLSLSVSGLMLEVAHSMIGYSLIFALSFVSGVASLYFLSRIPAAPVQPETAKANKIAWSQILSERGFVLFALLGLLVQALNAASSAFTIVFVRENTSINDGAIVLITAGAALLGIVSLRLLRNHVDRRGSKFFIALCLIWWSFYFLIWLLMAQRLIPNAIWLTAFMLLLNGLSAAAYDLAITRLTMNTAGDRIGSAQFFAVYQVGISLAAGVSPLLWGAVLDLLKNGATNRYVWFFGGQMALTAVLLLLLRRVRE